MADKKISVNEAVDKALHLDGDPENLRDYYDRWAGRYDADMGEVSYAGPDIGADLLCEFMPGEYGIKILDAGCGTGQVGLVLTDRGYQCIDGFDLSESMAQKARETKSYREVYGNVDIMQAADTITSQAYDALLCVGVFTLGHVPPQAMGPLVELARPGGLLIVSTRNLYYDESDFQSVVDELISKGQLSLLKLIKDAPYNKDGLAHYWVFRK